MQFSRFEREAARWDRWEHDIHLQLRAFAQVTFEFVVSVLFNALCDCNSALLPQLRFDIRA